MLFDKSIVFEEINQIPQDWNDFWHHAKSGYDFIINRNEEAMVWRYFDNPNNYKLMTLRKNKRLIGYLVFRIVNDDDSKQITIADYITLPGEETNLIIGIRHIINSAFKYGANYVVLWCEENSPYYNIFKKYGFFVRNNIPVICYQNLFTKKLEKTRSWHFTIADSDNI